MRFLAGTAPASNQIEFLGMIADELTENGVMAATRLYEASHTNLNPLGVDGVSTDGAADEMVAVLDEVRRRAAA